MENRIILSREEKLSLLPFIALMADITFKIRQSGIFSVKVEIDSSNDDFFILAFNLISGGHNPQHVKYVLDNFIHSSANNSIDYVKKYIQRDVLTMGGEHPNYFMGAVFLSYFGFDFKQEFYDGLKALLPRLIYDSFFPSEFCSTE